jgi:hypothetical protein
MRSQPPPHPTSRIREPPFSCRKPSAFARLQRQRTLSARGARGSTPSLIALNGLCIACRSVGSRPTFLKQFVIYARAPAFQSTPTGRFRLISASKSDWSALFLPSLHDACIYLRIGLYEGDHGLNSLTASMTCVCSASVSAQKNGRRRRRSLISSVTGWSPALPPYRRPNLERCSGW